MPRARRRPCLGNGKFCPTRALTTDPTGRCDHCRSQRNINRGSSTQRGYDQHHRTLREWWTPRVATGTITCWRCNRLIKPDDDWDLGHQDRRQPGESREHAGPEHQACNRATSAHKRRSLL